MWRCVNCGEESEDSFDACWNCGTASDGTPNPCFHREALDESASGVANQASSDSPFTHAELGVLVCRCIALWMFLTAIEGMTGSILYETMFAEFAFADASIFTRSGVPVVHLLISITLWMNGERIGRRMVLRPNAALHILRSNVRSVLPAAFVVFGVFLSLRQISFFVRSAVYLIEHRDEFFDVWRSPVFQLEFWPAVVNFALGLWLIFDARRIVRRITGRKPLRLSSETDSVTA